MAPDNATSGSRTAIPTRTGSVRACAGLPAWCSPSWSYWRPLGHMTRPAEDPVPPSACSSPLLTSRDALGEIFDGLFGARCHSVGPCLHSFCSEDSDMSVGERPTPRRPCRVRVIGAGSDPFDNIGHALI